MGNAYYSQLPPQASSVVIHRNYRNLTGVDFSSDAGNVGTQRAARGLNMYRTYSARLGECIQTRPGFRSLGRPDGGRINGIHRAVFAGGERVVVHAGSKLWLWEDYPCEFDGESCILLFDGANDERSRTFVMGGAMYFMDGENYLRYDGEGGFTDAAEFATVPITVTGRSAAGGGQVYQQVNMLTPRRKNSFTCDGRSLVYKLDAEDIDGGEVFVTLEGNRISDAYTVDYAAGEVVFNVPPAAADPVGTDNMIIEFSKTTEGYAERVKRSRCCAIYDDRIFISGNPLYKNYNFHSFAGDPCYFGDLSYYTIGGEEFAVNGLLVVFDQLLSLKQNKIFRQSGADSGDNLMSRVYPVVGGAECAGAVAPFGYANFLDDAVFISELGLEGMDRLSNAEMERYVGHRSARVDGCLQNEERLCDAFCAVYGGYLLVLINGAVYLADSRKVSGGQYEWFYWDNVGLGAEISPARVLFCDGDALFIGTQDGRIGRLNNDMLRADGSEELMSAAFIDDGGRAIKSLWAFCFDDFGRPNQYKTLLKKGNVIHARAFSHSSVKIGYRTDREHETLIGKINSGYFDFNDIDFEDFTFNTFDETDLVFKRKVKKFKRLQVIVYCDEPKKSFGIYSLVLAARVGGHYGR